MSWLKPTAQSGYDPDAKVRAFLDQYGQKGQRVLDVFNIVDPLKVFYVPDEYLGYAERFLKGLEKVLIEGDELTFEAVREVARRTFSVRQITDGWVTPDCLEKLFQELFAAAQVADTSQPDQ